MLDAFIQIVYNYYIQIKPNVRGKPMKTINDHSFTKAQKKVLKTVYLHPGVTRMELAELAGISEKSVIRYVSDFMDRRLIVSKETRSSRVGRSSELLTLNPSLFSVLALDVGGYCVKAGIVDLSGNVTEKQIWYKDELKASDLPLTEELRIRLKRMLEKSGKNPIGLGIGISGMIDRRENTIYYCPNIQGMVNVDTAETFGKYLGLPVSLDTGARCLALAEQRYGGHGNADNMIYVSVGHSISAGIIINGKIYRGADSKAGEIGHTPCYGADPESRCTCGSTGCLELYATLPMLMNIIRDNISNENIFSSLRTMLGDKGKLDIEAVKKAYGMHDRFVTEAVADAGQKLGTALAFYINAFNPSLVVFGGSMAEYFPFVIDETIREITRTVLPAALMNTELKISALDYVDAAVKGAAIQVQNAYFDV